MAIEIRLTGVTVVAWWGAIVSTGVLAWDVYKWRTSGARLRLLVQTGMRLLGDPEREDEDLVTVRVTNIGGRPTTITTVALVYYSNWLRKIRRRPTQTFLVPRPNLNHEALPHLLNVGQEWMGGMTQTNDIVEMASTGCLVAQVYDSVHKKPVEAQVIIRRA